MPHFVIDCSKNILSSESPETIIQSVFNAAESTMLFDPEDIKVRISPFDHYTVGNRKQDFIHVFTNIMEGRSIDQKSDLSKKVVSVLKSLFPSVPFISINIRDFEKETYCNRTMI